MAKKKSATTKTAGTGGGAASGTRKPKVTAAADVSRCPKCGSTEREPYHHPRELAQGGEDRDGNAYTHVVWRNTACRSCGQARVDRTYENRLEA